MVEESAPLDSVGPFKEEPMAADPGDGAGGEASGSVDHKETQSSKALPQSQAAEEEEEEEEPDVYYFESDHLALKHNKEYVGCPWGFLLSLSPQLFCCFSHTC